MQDVLKLLKMDLSITSAVKDVFFMSLIEATAKELKGKFNFEIENVEDKLLLSDYAAWKYRNRIAGAAMPQNLQYRIRNKIVRGRTKGG